VGVAAQGFEPDVEKWDAWRPEEAARRLAGVEAPWYVAAGWAIDLFLGGGHRAHEDLELAIPACALDEVVAALYELDVFVVGVPADGLVTPLEHARDRLAETHQTWLREPETGLWRLDLFREPGDETTWVCRRDEGIRLPYDKVIAWTDDGIPYGRPEVVLLYKAKHVEREKDQADFDAALPHLEPETRACLAGWLELVHPGHAWLEQLR
jgi:hypothetical protein